MPKGALSNQLLGRRIRPRIVEYPGGGTHEYHWPSDFKPNRYGSRTARIEAAWVDKDGAVKALARDPWGTCAELWLTQVTSEPDND